MASSEIHSVKTTSGNQPAMRRIIEEAGQTFLSGTPVQTATGDGGVQAIATSGIPLIAGFSKEGANNLATLGVIPTAAVTPPQSLTFGSVPFQTSAKNIGRPLFNDGRIGFEVANDDTVFAGQVGPAQTAVASDVGKSYGLTIDGDGHWFVDRTKSTLGTNTQVTIVGLDPNDQSATPRGVLFVVLNTQQQFSN